MFHHSSKQQKTTGGKTDLHECIRHGFRLLSQSPENPAADRCLDFLLAPQDCCAPKSQTIALLWDSITDAVIPVFIFTKAGRQITRR
jgi:hypothetical protein